MCLLQIYNKSTIDIDVNQHQHFMPDDTGCNTETTKLKASQESKIYRLWQKTLDIISIWRSQMSQICNISHQFCLNMLVFNRSLLKKFKILLSSSCSEYCESLMERLSFSPSILLNIFLCFNYSCCRFTVNNQNIIGFLNWTMLLSAKNHYDTQWTREMFIGRQNNIKILIRMSIKMKM